MIIVWRKTKRRGEVRRGSPYLAGADLVEGDKGKGLGEHCGGEVLLGHGEGYEDAGEDQLREEGY